MKRNKKAFWIMVISIVAVFVVGTIATTYAWFLSRFGRDYEFTLTSESDAIIKFETNLTFAIGATGLVPAQAKQTVGTEQQALSPLDVFDPDDVSESYEGKVLTAASVVKASASCAYWTGRSEETGDFAPELHAYTNAFLGSTALMAHIGTYSDAPAVTADNLISLLEDEEDEYSAANRLLARSDLARQGEIGFFAVVDYLGITFLFYNGACYVRGTSSGRAFTLPQLVESDSDLRYWHTPTAENCSVGNVVLSDGTYIHLQPNTTFSITMYAFVAKTDEELDPVFNGERLSLFLTLRTE